MAARTNGINFNVSRYELKKIIDAKIDCNLTVKGVLAISSRPCNCCENKPVLIKCKDGTVIELERGLLYKESEINATARRRNVPRLQNKEVQLSRSKTK